MGFQPKMNKKGLEFKSAFFSLIVVSMVIVASGMIIFQWDAQYSSGIASEYDLEEFDTLASQEEKSREYRESLNPESATDITTDFEGATFRGAFGIVNTMFESFDLVLGSGGLIGGIGERFGVDPIFIAGFITLMTIAIAITIVAIIFRIPRGSA